ncbi:hypothetical protein HG263_20350 [Pseudoalteromonas sp. JBTF-M23]|uniref:Endonuclease III n=1 Tax=Pseudoalteromonas caenipelagi TaxID=2726988 RepID=A0A849VGJ9_9GAMM|nr:hypothetical protein [Pseudoalteromonas caenipelagi]
MGKDVFAVEEKLEQVVPKEFKVDVHQWFILHDRYVCTARKPKCDACLIEDLCEFKPTFKYPYSVYIVGQMVTLQYPFSEYELTQCNSLGVELV